MKALVIRNSTGSGLGAFTELLKTHHGFELETADAKTCDFSSVLSPDHDLVVVLGSPRGVYEAEEHPWIAAELEFIRSLLETKTPLIGICFGAQLIAACLGREVRKMVAGPIRGWRRNDAAVSGLWRGPWFRWHGDRFDFPQGAEILASDGDLPQAFQVASAVAVQFHPEVDEDIIRDWIAEARAGQYALPEMDKAFEEDVLDELARARQRTERLLEDMLKRVLA